MNSQKYRPFPPVDLPNRQWPGKVIEKAPIWCSVDLRDGNQALETPMNLEAKIAFFKFLTEIGFKEIEIGFPAASETEFIFTRTLIEQNLIPDDVVIQVLTQSREHIIEKTFEALKGVKKAVVHLYNSTSTLQRRVVFRKNRAEILALAADGARMLKKYGDIYGEDRFVFEYSPESFTGTELDFAAEICNRVLDIWQPTADNKTIINLPSTVEMATPNIYADQIEYMCGHLNNRENVIVSLHTHNDRGTGVAATELGILAGADRVEGTLFGNGERTGNADLMNVALNMYTQGIDPGLDFSNINDIIKVYEKSTAMPVHPRHPYAGDLVYTAFSGSHQDAIKKGMDDMAGHPGQWEVPYLPIDPMDLGRSYDPIIRINSQSGKGGVAYILEHNFGIVAPKAMQQDFGNKATAVSDKDGKELQPEEIHALFMQEYVNLESPVQLVNYHEKANGQSFIVSNIKFHGEEREIESDGDGLVDAFCKGITKETGMDFEITNYAQHSLEYGTKSRAITYISVKDSSGRQFFGAGISSNISKSSIRAVVSSVNNMMAASGKNQTLVAGQ